MQEKIEEVEIVRFSHLRTFHFATETATKHVLLQRNIRKSVSLQRDDLEQGIPFVSITAYLV